MHTFSQADADRGASKYPGLTVEELKHGKELYELKCAQCHPAGAPSSKTADEWKKIVPDMAAKAAQNGKDPITKSEQQTILKYLTTMTSNGKS